MLRRFFSSDEISRDFGLLLVRVGVGLSVLIFHGYGKITGGPERWERIGGSMVNVNVEWLPVFWGFMAGFSEAIGSCLLIVGVLFRPAAFLLACTMLVAAMNHLSRAPDEQGAGWNGASHALELLSVYLCLLFTGPGRFSLTMRGK